MRDGNSEFVSRSLCKPDPLLVCDHFLALYQADDGPVHPLPVTIVDPLAVGFVLDWVKNSCVIYCPA